jgi:hypothetical protein
MPAAEPGQAGRSQDALAGRYEIGRLLGSGSFGAVYLARDLRTGALVAIKHLQESSPQRLFRFKREFRVLADCVHPNLIRYDELLKENRHWYLVMEYIDGPNLFEFVRRAAAATAHDETVSAGVRAIAVAESSDGYSAHPPGPLVTGIGRADDEAIARIRAILPQLANGLSHLHQAGVVHRDLSPRNILVEASGRVVILDFGLALKGPMENAWSEHGQCVGTPRYMAPEQGTGRRATRASDWYAVGAMLYEMLLGVPPFDGASPRELLLAKSSGSPVHPRMVEPTLPADLCDLCMDLLQTAPERRPADAARRLRRCAYSRSTSAISMPVPEVPFIGRAEALAQLDGVRREWQAGGASGVLLVRGPSGIGKTSLVERFLARADPACVVLRGRCYQREAVPFKTLDALAESLCAHLQAMPADGGRPALPADIAFLAKLLPTLLLLPAVERAVAKRPLLVREPHELRRRAIAALRELLVALAARRPLIVAIDDMQWSDADSREVLPELLGPPGAPALLLVLCAASDSGDGALGPLMDGLAGARIPLHQLTVGPLGQAEAVAFVRRVQAITGDDAVVDADGLYREFGGNPLLLRELVLAHQRLPRGERQATLRTLLVQRVRSLGDGARRLLTCAAVAGRPRRVDLLSQAAACGGDLPRIVHQLCAEYLLRTDQHGDHHEVAVFHEKIAEAALALLDEDGLRSRHMALATVLAREGDGEAEAVFQHWLEAGEPRRAYAPGLVAAGRAVQGLAFDRAAGIYRRLLGIAPPDAPRHELRLRLAEALACAGQGLAAAREFEEIAADPATPDRLDALQRAAGQYLRHGHIDAGVGCAQAVLHEVGLEWHRHPGTTLGMLLRGRLELWWRGIQRPTAGDTAAGTAGRLRMDALWSIGHGLGWVDTLRGAELHVRHLNLALDLGEPFNISRGLAWEAILTASEGGGGSRARARGLLEAGHDLARRITNDHAIAWCHAAEAYLAWIGAEWARCLEACARAVAHFARVPEVDTAWEQGSLRALCWMPALLATGRLDELARHAAAVEHQSQHLGDLYTLVTLRTAVKPWLQLIADDADAAQREVDAAMQGWSCQDWHLQHLFAAMAAIRIALYRGDGAGARRLAEQAWPRFTRSLQSRLQVERVAMLCLRSQAVIMAHATTPATSADITGILDDIRQLEREGTALARTQAVAVRAALLAVQGHGAAAAAAHGDAAARYDGLGMPLHALACRRRAAEIAGDPVALEEADRELDRSGVRAPARLVAVLAAGPPAGGA